MAYSGKYFPKNPHKYKGDVNNIIYRSLWERTFQVWCDENEDILEWSSEETIVMYRDPSQNGKLRRYFPDFKIKTRQADGSIKEQLIEVKPDRETKEPVKPKRVTKKFIKQVTTYLTNMAKWKAAREVCKDNGWEFVVITEKNLYPKQHK